MAVSGDVSYRCQFKYPCLGSMGNLRQVPSLTMYPPIPCAYHRTCCIVGAQQIISRRMYIRMELTHHVILGKSLLPSGSVSSFVGGTVGGSLIFLKSIILS